MPPRTRRSGSIQRGHSRFNRPLFACTHCAPGLDLAGCPEIGRMFWYHTSPAGAHQHRHLFEIGYFPEGHRGYRHGTRTLVIPPGSALISPPGMVHGEGPMPGLTQDLWWFQLRWPDGQALPGIDPDDSRELRRRLVAAADLGPLPMTATYSRDFYHLLCALFAQTPYVRIKARSLLHALLCMLVDGAEKVTSGTLPTAADPDPALDPALALMHQRLEDPPAMAELAEACSLSERRFRTRFQDAHHLPPSDYLQRLRVRSAMQLLDDDELSIAEAARATGFGTAQYFSTVFKRLTQMTPSQWRWLYHRRQHHDDPAPPPDLLES